MAKTMICKFNREEIDEAMDGLNGMRELIVPFFRVANLEGVGEQDAKEFTRHIEIALCALAVMGTILDGDTGGMVVKQ